VKRHVNANHAIERWSQRGGPLQEGLPAVMGTRPEVLGHSTWAREHGGQLKQYRQPHHCPLTIRVTGLTIEASGGAGVSPAWWRYNSTLQVEPAKVEARFSIPLHANLTSIQPSRFAIKVWAYPCGLRGLRALTLNAMPRPKNILKKVSWSIDSFTSLQAIYQSLEIGSPEYNLRNVLALPFINDSRLKMYLGDGTHQNYSHQKDGQPMLSIINL